ncbi:MAG TPA: DUF427 domain-containing protein [Chloroflexota bacterium]|nr:DUF427 domain-containing protein [Chloroflexota bacterium]
MGDFKLDPSPRWVRVFFGGVALGDSKRMKLLYEPGRLPLYCFPEADVRTEMLSSADHRTQSEHLGGIDHFDVKLGERVAPRAAVRFEAPDLQGLIAFDWNSMDNWFEEDDEIFVHPRDPYKRIDVLRSSRHMRVVLGGETIADTQRPSLLFETHLPTRYYIPRMDVRMDLLTPTDTHTRCPYKGVASYWTARIGGQEFKDVVWSYQVPIPECPKIEQLMCFFNERVDAIYVDGEAEQKPVTKWSL